MPTTVALGNINPGTVTTAFMKSVLAAHDAGVFSHLLMHESGPYLDVGRNVVTSKFYENHTDDYLLFVDSDVIFKPEDVTNLLAHAEPTRIVSGVYYSTFEAEGYRPVASRFVYDPELKSEALKPINPRILDDVSDEGLVKVDGVGAGFMMFHRQLLTVMKEVFGYPMPWFVCQTIDKSEQWYGEDYIFCLRAKFVGASTFLVPSVRVMHRKMMIL